MEIPLDAFPRFILQQRSTVAIIESDETQFDSFYVVIAKIYGIVSTSPAGIDLAVADHTGKALLALRAGPAAACFDKHLFQYPDDELIIDPYALDDEWDETYLFKICKGKQNGVLGHVAFIVDDICMHKPTVDHFAVNKMTDQERHVYKEAVSQVHKREFPTNIGLLSTRDFNTIHPNIDVGFKKRIYAPFKP